MPAIAVVTTLGAVRRLRVGRSHAGPRRWSPSDCSQAPHRPAGRATDGSVTDADIQRARDGEARTTTTRRGRPRAASRRDHERGCRGHPGGAPARSPDAPAGPGARRGADAGRRCRPRGCPVTSRGRRTAQTTADDHPPVRSGEVGQQGHACPPPTTRGPRLTTRGRRGDSAHAEAGRVAGVHRLCFPVSGVQRAARLGAAGRRGWRHPSAHGGGRWLGALDRGDLELERDLLAHQDAARLEAGVEVDAPVLAVDDGRALEAAPMTPAPSDVTTSPNVPGAGSRRFDATAS